MFLYWGQRGAMGRFALALTRAVKDMEGLDVVLSVSEQNELFDEFMRCGLKVLPLPMVSSRTGPIHTLYRIPAFRRAFAESLRAHQVEAVVTLMSHVWSPLVTGIVKTMGIPYTVIVHDVKSHIGDPTGLVNRWLLRDAYRADRIVTLSQSVTDELASSTSIPRKRVVKLFLPNLCYDDVSAPRHRDPSLPLRLLFFGRILPYKGLPVFVSAVQKVRRQGIPVDIGVFGEGYIGPELRQLEDLGATVVNNWVGESEIDAIFAKYDVVVLSHIQATQSGVAALAFGNGMPVVTTPVGGLAEQVVHEVNGLIAETASADALAAQISRLATEPGLYDRLSRAVVSRAGEQSMKVFADKLLDCCFHARR
jgi:glycosyltransferase involved in cell wall biosynthesis